MRREIINNLPFPVEIAHAVADEPVEEYAAGYAVGSLSRDESDDYAAHIGHCRVCAQLVSGFSSASEMLGDALAPEPVNAALRGRIIAEARADLASQRPSERAPAPAKPPSRWPALAMPMAAIFAAIAIGFAIWSVFLQIEVNDQNAKLERSNLVLDEIASGSRVLQLDGTEAAPGSMATLIFTPGTGRATLVVRGLAELASGFEYQVWRIQGDTPTSAGLFKPSSDPDRTVTVLADFGPTDTVAVSIEPTGGSPSPTGDIVLLGSPTG